MFQNIEREKREMRNQTGKDVHFLKSSFKLRPYKASCSQCKSLDQTDHLCKKAVNPDVG